MVADFEMDSRHSNADLRLHTPMSSFRYRAPTSAPTSINLNLRVYNSGAYGIIDLSTVVSGTSQISYKIVLLANAADVADSL